MRRAVTLATAATGGLVVAGVAFWALTDHARGPAEPPSVPLEMTGTPLDMAERREVGALRPSPASERSIMSSRYISNMLIAIAAAFVLVAAQAFAPSTVGWIAFAVTGVGVLVLTAVTVLASGRGVIQRTLDGVVAALAVWTIVESLIFSGSLMVWLSFGAAAAIAALAVAGLTAHELSTERVVHSLEDVRTSEHRMGAIA